MSAPTTTEIDRAIATVQSSRQTHVEWRDYWLRLGHDRMTNCSCGRDHARDAGIAGDLAHHIECIENYDQVLDVLRRIRA